jgi:hypothetical protein
LKINVKALIIGYLLSLGGGILISFITLSILSSGIFDSIVGSSLITQTYLSYVSLGLTSLIDILSGYFTAKLSKQNEIIHGLLLGFVIWIISILLPYFSFRQYHMNMEFYSLQNLYKLCWPLLFCFLGAWLLKKIKDKNSENFEHTLEQKIDTLGNH